ncbi:FG-GAP-like repeat-containing protein [Actinospongicola halichondriae]|uniref:FG-GAP-like repeat-containing protein n=1 Tax=Actinospongicola halichondriae TaxID=3236844 RepID=UPI003D492489
MREHGRPLGTRPIVAIATTLVLLALTIPTAAPAGAAACTDPFTASFRADLRDRFPGQRVTAAVYDTRTDCWYHLDRGMEITTASVIKAQFLAGVLLRAQDEGRGLTSFERSRLEPTMWLSHNPPASELFHSLGGVAGLESMDRRFGLTRTSHTTSWGATVSTAEDRTRLAVAMLHGGGALGATARGRAWQFMTAVHPTQQWGISAGVPAGYTVALKNGFYPLSGTARWRIGSTGFVRDDLTGEGYAITVQSDRNATHAAGQALVEFVSAEVATVLTTGDAAPRLVDRSRCVQASGGESWSNVASRLGVPGDPGGVQSVAGGGSSALSGMRACAPRLGSAPPVPGGSTINGVYLPLVGDFDGDNTDDIFWYAPGPAADFVWNGQTNGTFTSNARPVNGRYEPLVGDFDGDGTDDIFWYAPGPAADFVWNGQTNGTFTSNARPVNGRYEPFLGDFDGDGTDDIFWYAPGPASDFVWNGTPESTFASSATSVSGRYDPAVGDFDGDDADDVFWYASGSTPDFVWTATDDGSFASTARSVNGSFQPVVADLDGDARDDIVWYAPGADADRRWRATGGPADFASSSESLPDLHLPIVGDFDGDAADEVHFYGPGAHDDVLFDGSTRRSLGVRGRYEPAAGDFDGDGRVDILWYGRGVAADHLWLGIGDAAAPRSVTPTT